MPGPTLSRAGAVSTGAVTACAIDAAIACVIGSVIECATGAATGVVIVAAIVVVIDVATCVCIGSVSDGPCPATCVARIRRGKAYVLSQL